MDTFITARQILKLMITTVSFTSCTFNTPGVYVAKDNKNRNDTLFIYNNQFYIQKITNKKGVVLYKNKGTWEKGHNGDIHIYSFFCDGDSLYQIFKGKLAEGHLSNLPFEKGYYKKSHVIYWMEYIDLPETYHYYYKIKDYE